MNTSHQHIIYSQARERSSAGSMHRSISAHQHIQNVLLLFFLTQQILLAQVHLTTPLEILSFMEASPTKYEIEQLYGEPPKKDKVVIPHGAYIEEVNGKEHQLEYKDLESEKETAWKEKARSMAAVEKPNYKQIRKLYGKILKNKPEHAQIHTFIGETYYQEKRYDEALGYFQKAIQLNPIDYLARWLSAEIYLQQGLVDTAIYTMTLAHIYNRNHPRLFKRLLEVYRIEQKRYYDNWAFDPKMKIYKDSATVVISADGIWLTYGMYKAVWNYDTDYQYIKDQQEVTDYMFQQEMEATIGTFMTYNTLRKDDTRKYPAMVAFGDCLDAEMVEEYVMYEILLVDNPTLAFHTTQAFMKRLIHYINEVRSVDYVGN